jgi:gamma-glutamylaminecyclotransferase
MAKVHLFVYGSLKRGMSSHALLAGQEFVGTAQTLPRYRLYNCGRYPALVANSANGLAVQGEVWHVDETALASLDRYEGAPTLFIRREVALEGMAGPVYAYFYVPEVRGLESCGSVWPPG